VVADLDGGSVRVPENVVISLMPEPLMSRMILSLRLVSIYSFDILIILLCIFMQANHITETDFDVVSYRLICFVR